MSQGKLYIIATPIGNMEDITLRALRILRDEIDTVYCEDTRRTSRLLQHHGIKTRLKSLHAHSSDGRLHQALDDLSQGLNLAYCSDAGTPGVSDPGSKLVNMARDESYTIIPLPGPSALTTLASVTGFPVKEFAFSGFLSKKKGKRVRELESLKTIRGTLVIYESPYRIDSLLDDISQVFPGNLLVIGRELTKIHEQLIHGTAGELKAMNFPRKGEFSVAIFNDIK